MITSTRYTVRIYLAPVKRVAESELLKKTINRSLDFLDTFVSRQRYRNWIWLLL